MTGLPQGDSPVLLNTSYTVTADIDVPQSGAEGMILTSGGRFGGYGFYLLNGKPTFLWNMVDLERLKWQAADALPAGHHIVEFDFKYDGLGAGTLDVQQLQRRRPSRHRHVEGRRHGGRYEGRCRARCR